MYEKVVFEYVTHMNESRRRYEYIRGSTEGDVIEFVWGFDTKVVSHV